MKAVAALNVYKKVAVIRRATDSLNYEDAEGNLRTVSDLGHAASTATPALATASGGGGHHNNHSSNNSNNKAEHEIPVPQIKLVENYDTDIPDDYEIKSSYVRYHRPFMADWMEAVDYIADVEDETWLANNPKFGGADNAIHDQVTDAATTSLTETTKNINNKDSSSSRIVDTNTNNTQQLPLFMFEHIMDVLEKATGFDAIVSSFQAEQLIAEKVPGFTQLYPVKTGRVASGKADIVTSKHVVTEIYNYWVNKRSKLKRPLLRRYWPVTSTDDTNPHFVFRPREKEKYKLRKTRRNDMLSFQKMKQMRQDFDNLRHILELVRKREQVYRAQVQMQCEWFQQKLFDMIDTSGKPRKTSTLLVKKRDIDMVMTSIPTYFDHHYSGAKRSKRAGRRGSTESRSVSPVPTTASISKVDPESSGTASADAAPRVVAGQNLGQPAPSFLDPLYTRESYVTSWNNAVPHVTSYIESHALPTNRFRHRPRVGRGGRLCIDRLPCPSHPDITPLTFFTAGKGLARQESQKHHSYTPLVDLLPEPLDAKAISRRIEEMSVAALQEEIELSTGELPATEDNSTTDLVLVKMDKYLETDEQLWGEERFSFGPV
jgi:enhancer of polycomb-like protein